MCSKIRGVMGEKSKRFKQDDCNKRITLKMMKYAYKKGSFVCALTLKPKVTCVSLSQSFVLH